MILQLLIDVASGLSYLHSVDIVHGVSSCPSAVLLLGLWAASNGIIKLIFRRCIAHCALYCSQDVRPEHVMLKPELGASIGAVAKARPPSPPPPACLPASRACADVCALRSS